jgi:hypothetical protein
MAKAKNRQSGKREPNGRLSRQADQIAARLRERFKDMDQEERDTIQPGIEARQRVYGLDTEKAASPAAGTFLGRLYLNKEISRTQYEAGILWADHTEAYQHAIAAPKQPGAVDLNATKGSSNYENVAATRRAVVRMLGDKERGIIGAREAIQNEQYSLANQGSRFALLFVLWTAIERDEERYDIVGDLRVALNCLSRHFGLMGERKAA